MNQHYNPASGPIERQPGAGYPPAEGIPSTFQMFDVSASLTWQVVGASTRTMWSTGQMLLWPQIRNEMANRAAPRRLPGAIIQGEILAQDFLDPQIGHSWVANLDILVSANKQNDMRSIYYPFQPRVHETLISQNLCFRFILQPSPRYVEVRILFFHLTAGLTFKPFNVRADVRPTTAVNIQPGQRLTA